MALLASLLFGERLSAVGYGGLVAGVAGLCLLEVPPAALQALVEDGPAGDSDPHCDLCSPILGPQATCIQQASTSYLSTRFPAHTMRAGHGGAHEPEGFGLVFPLCLGVMICTRCVLVPT